MLTMYTGSDRESRKIQVLNDHLQQISRKRYPIGYPTRIAISELKRRIRELESATDGTCVLKHKTSHYPKPIKITERSTAWPAEEVWALTED